MIAPLIGMPQGAEWLVILAIVVLVFGAAKLPELARGSGQALRIFKSETKGLRDDDDEPKPAPLPPTTAEQTPPAPVVQPTQPVQQPVQPVQSSPVPPLPTEPARVDPADKPQA